MSQKSVKGWVIADMLADYPKGVRKDNPPDDRISAVEEDTWTMFFDGAVNLSGSAEYEACILGLQAAIEMGVTKLKVFGDSTLIILQTLGEWKTKDAKLVPYHGYLEKLARKFQDISFEYLPRIHNQFADALATLSSMLQATKRLEVEPLKIEVLARQAYCMAITEELDGKPWYYDIMKYVQKQEFLEQSTPSDRKYLMKMASKFFVSGENLYKRSYDSVLLRCVDAAEATRIMQEIHEGVCGPHMNGCMLAKKIMRLGYYWLPLE
ncbi:uncharacterized protein LOC120293665 [Eucalyptus grandis]|uniref:uncharacterized protein LOC120293665 n=1 Tax=Eucalyptus grandis TaxID=71139 RepID=UPI00192EF659|nr:uncharacterized protein LOC120293665 [Eucalyptus grandis]